MKKILLVLLTLSFCQVSLGGETIIEEIELEILALQAQKQAIFAAWKPLEDAKNLKVPDTISLACAGLEAGKVQVGYSELSETTKEKVDYALNNFCR